MVKDNKTKTKKQKSSLSLGKKDKLKVNLSFKNLAKKVVKVEVKEKK